MLAFGQEDVHDGTKCRICDCIWLTKIRHRRICLGSLCYVPSHSRNLLFEEDGTRLDKNDMWNRHFLEFSTQVSEQEIEEAQQQELMYSPPRPFPLPNEAEQNEEVEAVNEEELYQSDDEAIIPIQQIPEGEPVALENEEVNTSPPRVVEECEENYIVGDDNDDIEPRDPLAPDE
ncbi:Diphthine methyl ester synthase [Orchesella cincta]|uniref:Diphthine methyl ester synthase n=1 Tax=Orchesella cincta TaxID=48709 RepID=A0A1D2NFF9_ORCCI|nr:Diphthine methyl ester synthase [Orchesella cincta]